MTAIFVALVSSDRTGGFRASFPDLPNCFAVGLSLPEALVNAERAAAEHLKALLIAGNALPNATPVARIATGPGTMALLLNIALDLPTARTEGFAVRAA